MGKNIKTVSYCQKLCISGKNSFTLNKIDPSDIFFFLYISKDEQKQWLQSRLNRLDKHWKFDHADLKERVLCNTYTDAFEQALNQCSTPYASWYVIPANHKWSRDVMIGQIVLETLQHLDLNFPEPQPGLNELVIPE